MADEQKPKVRLEIAHVLFIDIVGYSKLLTDEQSEALHELNQIVRYTETAREADAAGQLTILPTGDGMALVFSGSVEEPAECALQISHALRAQPSLPVRMGIHSGPVHHVKDANERENIAGVGINIAQRVMDVGDAGHILISKRVADDLAQHRRWQPYLHELGNVEVKHGEIISLVNFYAETIGNPTPPARIGKLHGHIRSLAKGARRGLPAFARAVLIFVGLLIVLMFILAIVSVIFAPAIMRSFENRKAASAPSPSATPTPLSLSDTIKSTITNRITEELKQDLGDKKKTGAAAPAAADSAVPEKSIAVLPFENLSSDKENAYFAEGIQDELLTRLAKVGDLKVISRTSTEKYKSAPDDLPEIAQQLGVANVLEGSVQKFGDQVRINVQLIRALNDSHLWAETYDRKLIDTFGVESDVAQKIVSSLEAKLTGSEKRAITARPTQNPEAYQLYLKGRFFWNKRTGQDLKVALDYFQKAIAADPNYATAYAAEGDTCMLIPIFSAGTPKEYFPKAETASRRAIELDDTNAEGHAALANLLFLELKFAESEKEFRRSIELNPNYATAHHWYGNSLLAALGRFDEAIAEGKRSVELDPLSLIINADFGSTLMVAGRYDEAVAQLQKTLALDSNFYYAHWNLGETLYYQGDVAGCIRQCEKARSLEEDPEELGLLGRAYIKDGRRDDGLKMLDALKAWAARGYVRPELFSMIYMALGDNSKAIQLLEDEYKNQDGFDLGGMKTDPRLDPLRDDPRFKQLLGKVFPADTQ